MLRYVYDTLHGIMFAERGDYCGTPINIAKQVVVDIFVSVLWRLFLLAFFLVMVGIMYAVDFIIRALGGVTIFGNW